MGVLSQIAIKLNRSTDAGLKCSTSLTHIKSFAAKCVKSKLKVFFFFFSLPVQFIVANEQQNASTKVNKAEEYRNCAM